MGTYLYRTENVALSANGGLTTFTHGLGVAPANEQGEVFIRHRTFTHGATVVSSNSQIVVLASPQDGSGIRVDLTVMRFHSLIS